MVGISQRKKVIHSVLSLLIRRVLYSKQKIVLSHLLSALISTLKMAKNSNDDSTSTPSKILIEELVMV